MLALAGPAAGQDGGRTLPTLESLGIGPWSNESGSIQFALSGRADVDAYFTGDDPTHLIRKTETFVAPRVRLFADLFVGASWFASAELRFDHGPVEAWEGHDFRVEQAFLRWSPLELLALQAGRFASPFASYPSRHHTEDDWFIRPPLMYEYRTTALASRIPPDEDVWVTWKDSADLRARGAPPVWGAPYQWGGMAFGVWRDLSWRVAYMNGAPSSGPSAWDRLDFERGNLVAALGWRFAPWVRTEFSYSTGPFMGRNLAEESATVPDGHEITEYTQEIFSGELLFELQHTQLRAEAFHDTWNVARVLDDAIDISWSVEARQELFQDWFVAGR
ncbi:MAG TPA: hypothetical protein VEA38_00240, partial [Terriglobales bacterium]|nr:hypothetical protein [Terriglobales bacterium]